MVRYVISATEQLSRENEFIAFGNSDCIRLPHASLVNIGFLSSAGRTKYYLLSYFLKSL